MSETSRRPRMELDFSQARPYSVASRRLGASILFTVAVVSAWVVSRAI